jgi:uncharacterized protein (DUF983 family)
LVKHISYALFDWLAKMIFSHVKISYYLRVFKYDFSQWPKTLYNTYVLYNKTQYTMEYWVTLLSRGYKVRLFSAYLIAMVCGKGRLFSAYLIAMVCVKGRLFSAYLIAMVCGKGRLFSAYLIAMVCGKGRLFSVYLSYGL